MAETPVVNASPLIVLAKADLLDLLRLIGEPGLVPEAVAAEVRAHSDDSATKALADHLWLQTVAVPSIPSLILAWDLGDGESSVLAAAHGRPGAVAVLDDLLARRCAATLGVPICGCLGLCLLARRRGRFPAARPLVERLRQGGLYLSDAVIDRALALVGE